MTTGMVGNAFVSKKHKLLRQADQFLTLLRKDFVEKYGKTRATAIRKAVMAEYERIIPQLPDVGGQANPLIQNLIQSASALALYRVIKNQGGTVEEAGEWVQRGLEAMLNRIPAFLRKWMGLSQFSPFALRKMQEAARTSQERKYAGDWVFEFVMGDGQQFDYGIDFTECAIVKFMEAQDAKELTPYLCNTDFIVSKATRTGLRRTQNLAWGCQKCDFRYSKGGLTLAAWPPTFPEQPCGGTVVR